MIGMFRRHRTDTAKPTAAQRQQSDRPIRRETLIGGIGRRLAGLDNGDEQGLLVIEHVRAYAKCAAQCRIGTIGGDEQAQVSSAGRILRS